jgi:hypothetical protein
MTQAEMSSRVVLEAFDRWVGNGALHKEVVDEPFENPTGKRLRQRAVYYTPKGEEWRVSAHKLIRDDSYKSGGWKSTLNG